MIRQPFGYRYKNVKIRFCWTKCELCEMEFKQERMWKIYNHTNPYKDNDFFFCMKCCPTAISVERELLSNGEIKSYRLNISNLQRQKKEK